MPLCVADKCLRTKTGRTAPSPGKSIQPLCGGYDSLSLDPPDHHLINLHIRAGRFEGYGEGFAMPFITQADLAALSRYPDRQSVRSGKRVLVRVDLGGLRIIKKKKKYK